MVNLLKVRIRPNQPQQAKEGGQEHVEITPEPSSGSDIDSSGAAVQKRPLKSPTNNNHTTPQTPDTIETIWDRAEQFFGYEGACVSPAEMCTKWHERHYSPQRNIRPSSPMARVTSRTYEEIEVSEFHHVKVRLPPTHPVVEPAVEVVRKRKLSDAPIENLVLDVSTLERNISELTMRSSYAADHNLHSTGQESRRMAYYAVGKYHKIGGPGGNRRCYFTGKFGCSKEFGIKAGTHTALFFFFTYPGKLIFGPFYAGCVVQGLRTLVVFCLPSALGLPDPAKLTTHHSSSSTVPTKPPASKTPSSLASRTSVSRQNNRSGNLSTASKSKMSSQDDFSISIEGDLDPNWSLDRDFLLKVLPPASSELLDSIKDKFPEQFETLPVQVRDPKLWKLYIKFCFFSGLPIENGELHYKVLDDIAESVYGEEICLSHDVLEASTGASSAEILQLPNRTVMRYLRKHYSQQCSKLDDRIFQRASWERVAPEV